MLSSPLIYLLAGECFALAWRSPDNIALTMKAMVYFILSRVHAHFTRNTIMTASREPSPPTSAVTMARSPPRRSNDHDSVRSTLTHHCKVRRFHGHAPSPEETPSLSSSRRSLLLRPQRSAAAGTSASPAPLVPLKAWAVAPLVVWVRELTAVHARTWLVSLVARPLLHLLPRHYRRCPSARGTTPPPAWSLARALV